MFEQNTTTYDVENPDPGLEQAYRCGGIKPVNTIPTLSFWSLDLQLQNVYQQAIKNKNFFSIFIISNNFFFSCSILK